VNPSGTSAVTEPDLSGFLLVHAGFRVEFGRLADAIGTARDDRHTALIEDQIEFVLSYLHHHHADEDDWVWPLLRSRAPGSVPLLDALEEQHEQIDPDLAVAGDRSRPLAERAEALRRLHTALRRHLDDEERDAVPLMRSHISPGEWETHGLEVVRSYDRKRVPTLFGWASGAGSPEMVRRALKDFPPPIRLLFRLHWWPAYRRRHLRLYGTPLRRHPDRADSGVKHGEKAHASVPPPVREGNGP
jgi:iron-sulfur cluster repair protein YtfE (RIC family)